MGVKRLQGLEENNGGGLFPNSGIGFLWCPQDEGYHPGALFASISQMNSGIGLPPNSQKSSDSLSTKFVLPDLSSQFSEILHGKEEEEEGVSVKNKKKGGFKLKIKVKNPFWRRIFSGGIAGAFSRTAVAPLETVRTHLMVGSYGNSSMEVFNNIVKNEGWNGLFRGNLVNVIRVAPSKAIELCTVDMVQKYLTPKPGEKPIIPPLLPISGIAGACGGISSTICTYPLELLKTRLTVQRGEYKGLVDAFVRIIREEGPAELFRGLTPSVIGVIPYAAANYFAYDTLKKTYKKVFKREDIPQLASFFIGAGAGAISSSSTYPLEVARKHMQAGALNGRVYKNVLDALASILKNEGVGGLYKGLGPSCMKIIPASGISFMCYEALKKILEEEEDQVKPKVTKV